MVKKVIQEDLNNLTKEDLYNLTQEGNDEMVILNADVDDYDAYKTANVLNGDSIKSSDLEVEVLEKLAKALSDREGNTLGYEIKKN